MAKEHLTQKMKKWIEARVTNAREVETRISTKGLISEIEGMFHIGTPNKKFERELEAEIERARYRIRKRRKQWKDLRSKMAKDLRVPEKMVERWKLKGFITSCTAPAMDGCVNIVREHAFYTNLPMTEDMIPDDHSLDLEDGI